MAAAATDPILMAPLQVVTSKYDRDAYKPPPGVMEAPHWIEQAERHVKMSKDFVASVDDRVEADLGHGLALKVRQSVAAFNELPADLRRMHGDPGPQKAAPPTERARCVEFASPSFGWWGVRIFVNDCLAADIVLAAGSASAIGGIIAAVCPPCAVVAGVVAGFLAIYAGWLAWADQHCGNVGAFINVCWVGPIWISTVC